MRAELKSIFSPEVDIAGYRPDDPSRFLVSATLSIGIEGEDGSADDFDVLICSVRSLAGLVAEARVLVARPLIVAERWDFPLILQRIQEYCASCEGEAWEDMVPMLARLGVWEFEQINAGERQPEH
jgi:hypothetical protein